MNDIEMQPFAEMFPPDNIHHHFVGQDSDKGIYAKELFIPAGYVLLGHEHTYDHLSILASGAIALTVGNGTRYVSGPCALTIKAGEKHQVRAITDAVWFCIHPTGETDPTRVDDAILAPV